MTPLQVTCAGSSRPVKEKPEIQAALDELEAAQRREELAASRGSDAEQHAQAAHRLVVHASDRPRAATCQCRVAVLVPVSAVSPQVDGQTPGSTSPRGDPSRYCASARPNWAFTKQVVGERTVHGRCGRQRAWLAGVHGCSPARRRSPCNERRRGLGLEAVVGVHPTRDTDSCSISGATQHTCRLRVCERIPEGHGDDRVAGAVVQRRPESAGPPSRPPGRRR